MSKFVVLCGVAWLCEWCTGGGGGACEWSYVSFFVVGDIFFLY